MEPGNPPSIHVVLVHPEIHWNAGNVGRSCLAFGAQLHLVKPLGFSLAARQVRRAGLDYWQHVDPRVWESWGEFEERLPELGRPFLFSAEASRSLDRTPITQPAVLVFGSESRGLPSDVRERFRDDLVAIPQREGPVRSLNVSTAVGIALFHARGT